MRVLVANKFWYRRGGLERVMFDEISWLERAGHEVAHFSTAHPSNDASPWSEHFAPYLELGESGGLGTGGRLRAIVRMFFNGEAARRFGRLLDTFRPDVVHVHGIHRQLSPSILAAARERAIPVVQTLHDYHHVCPADVLLYRGAEVCSPARCGRLWYGPCVSGRCLRGSLGASALSAAETAWQRVRRAYERGIARFISPSRFLAMRMLEGGWELPIDIVPNAVPSAGGGGQGDRTGAGEMVTREHRPGDGFAVIGRLGREKGVEVALEAARLAGARVTVAGDGPLGDVLRASHPEALFAGRLEPAGVEHLMHSCRAVVVPSRWFENASMTVLEAMAAGVAVIATDIGGTPELITDGVDGLLVPPGDAGALAVAMMRVAEDRGLAARLGAQARLTAQAAFSPERHLEGLLATYRAAIAPAS